MNNKFLLHPKPLWVIAALWCTMMCFVPLPHTYMGATSTSFWSFCWSNFPYLPVAAICALVVYEITPKSRIWRLLTVDIFTKLGYVLLVCVVWGLIWERLLNNPLPLGATFAAMGLVVLTTMFVARAMKSLGDVRAVLIGITAGTFMFASFEVVYQYTSLYFIPTWRPAERVLYYTINRWLLFIFPFVVACLFYYKRVIVRYKRTALILFGTLIAMWFVWVYVGHCWSIEVADDVKPLVMNWPMYQLLKTGQVVLAALLCCLGAKSE